MPSSLIDTLLKNRNLTDPTDIERFLTPLFDEHLHDPFLLHDMEKAVARILAAIAADEHIAIFSDYDCDGIPGAVVLHDFFVAIGYTNFENYIPHRHFEGFGLSTSAIDTLHKSSTALVITIDCGTTNSEAVTHARLLGIDVIITDHHEPGHELPAAVAIVNPKLGTYPFTELCGSAVVFKLVQAIIARGGFALPPGKEKWLLDMVGIATIADMVPLIGENRVFAHYGLMVLRKSRRPGLQKLLRKQKLDQRLLTEDDIGFSIGPRINAASRMGEPKEAFYMLAATDELDAGVRVNHLEELNLKRKAAVALMTREIHERLKSHTDPLPPVLVFGSPDWRPALVGLAANKLAEEYGRPAFLWGRDGNDVYKGSCRSGGGASVVRLMEAAAHLFHEHGGHHFSGGFSVRDEHIFTFGELLNEHYAALGEAVLIKQDRLPEADLTLGEVNDSLVSMLRTLAPYGTGNPKPLFSFSKVLPEKVEVFGKAKDHLKLVFQRDRGTLEAIAFFAGLDSFTVRPQAGVPISLLAHVEESYFMNRRQVRLRIIDILSTDVAGGAIA
ncbi:single-stranded-DNA-specific exonuclease RecJ [Patescibacteria group bacterium]|nr:single-stranded-DNA-specific exonuclease RecJ [Patescibacteria group bacterium]